ncbi:hypothetical protein TCAL_10615, partial [Tigriopus californicus]|eukprot:TCALIF_10615-PA protein Name:"Protein of unknown function" AED:0.01 eAED:0.01 QI:7/1/0.33/1/0/0/3/0/203
MSSMERGFLRTLLWLILSFRPVWCACPLSYEEQSDKLCYSLKMSPKLFAQAKEDCEKDDANLAIINTNEQLNIAQFFWDETKSKGGEGIWVGITNPSKRHCTWGTSACQSALNQFKWVNGLNFEYDTWWNDKIRANTGEECFRFRESSSVGTPFILDDGLCSDSWPFLCQAKMLITCPVSNMPSLSFGDSTWDGTTNTLGTSI